MKRLNIPHLLFINGIGLRQKFRDNVGQVDLQFDAEVVPAIGSVQVGQAIKLFINLTTETSWGATRRY